MTELLTALRQDPASSLPVLDGLVAVGWSATVLLPSSNEGARA